MKVLVPALALAAIAGASDSLSAQDTTLASWKTETISSAKLKERRTIFIATPEEYATGAARFPVLVILDADDRPQFGAAAANIRFLASRGAIPPVIVVGVANGKDRTHDMTPAASGKTATDFPTAGGADAFADFITDEVLPLVRSKYRTLPTTILAGHSFGGLFAIHVAARKPMAFHGVVAMSPSLWWNDTTSAAGYADEILRARGAPRLFATSGGLEGEIDRPTRRFAALIESSKPANLAFGYRGYPENDHGLTPAPSLADGLRFVFEPVSVQKLPFALINMSTDSATGARLLAESEAAYGGGARSLGLPELMPEPVLNTFGYLALQLWKNPMYAVSIFRRNVERYPESANVYDSLADGLIARGDTAAARVELRRAIDTATRTRHPVLAESRRKLQALEQATTQAGRPRP